MKIVRAWAVVDERGDVCGSEKSGLCIFRDKGRALLEKGSLEVVVPAVIVVEGLVIRDRRGKRKA